jgi:acyl-CoA hydrolase
MKTNKMCRLIKSEDLNHHGTLFAGRMAEWFVEGTFIAASRVFGDPNSVVCVKLHGLKFGTPANKGDIIELETKVVAVGNTSITVYGKVTRNETSTILVDGFTTFVCVDENGKKMPHNLLKPEANNEEEIALIARAKELK